MSTIPAKIFQSLQLSFNLRYFHEWNSWSAKRATISDVCLMHEHKVKLAKSFYVTACKNFLPSRLNCCYTNTESLNVSSTPLLYYIKPTPISPALSSSSLFLFFIIQYWKCDVYDNRLPFIRSTATAVIFPSKRLIPCAVCTCCGVAGG